MTQFRWEFGFDFNAAKAFGAVNPNLDPTSPALNEPIYLLQDGLVNVTDNRSPAWPTQLASGDTIKFRIFDLTSPQLTCPSSVGSAPNQIGGTNNFQFAIVDPYTGSAVDLFTVSPVSASDVSLAYTCYKPTVWPIDETLPSWTVTVGTETYLEVVSGIAKANLSVLIKVTPKSGDPKWFGLDPEIWIMDG